MVFSMASLLLPGDAASVFDDVFQYYPDHGPSRNVIARRLKMSFIISVYLVAERSKRNEAAELIILPSYKLFNFWRM